MYRGLLPEAFSRDQLVVKLQESTVLLKRKKYFQINTVSNEMRSVRKYRGM